MRVKQCQECNKTIELNVSICPHCGAKQAQSKLAVTVVVVTLALIPLSTIYYQYFYDSNTTPIDPTKEVINNVVDNNLTTINNTKFDQLQNGISYDKAVSIIGTKGQLISESGSSGTESHIQMYLWNDYGFFLFKGGKLINKSQTELK